jgi:hypothetical protein
MTYHSDRHPHSISRIENFATTRDGKKFAFCVLTNHGHLIDLEIEAVELGTFVQYLVANAVAVANRAFDDGVELGPRVVAFDADRDAKLA